MMKMMNMIKRTKKMKRMKAHPGHGREEDALLIILVVYSPQVVHLRLTYPKLESDPVG